jgi:histidyl-tRNA synthetase
MNRVSSIKGFTDLFAPQSGAFTRMEAVARKVFERYGFSELRTPILEHTELFVRGIGTDTDVVQKEMYTFMDKGERSVTMRPEATAGVMRAYLEANRQALEPISRFYTFGPMFRYERPQKGRLRQFHQINCECLGSDSPYADAELISMAMQFFDNLKIEHLTLELNSLGCSECRPAYRKLLLDWLEALDVARLCEDCKRRLKANPLRVLDCKTPSCRDLTRESPSIAQHQCDECDRHFSTVTGLLTTQGIKYVLNPRLVRGLDYYTRTAFEVVSQNIGAQGSVAGGGRYDGLAQELGGRQIPAIGFACGMECLAMLLPETELEKPNFHITVLDDAGLSAAFSMCQTLRGAGLTGDMAYQGKSMKAAMRQADKSGALFTLIIGSDELAQGTVMIKNMQTGKQNLAQQRDALTILTSDLF